MKIFLKNKLFFIIYIIILVFLIIISHREHHKQDKKDKQDNIEHFNSSVMLRGLRKQKYSGCKTKCESKYDKPEDISVCKAYCKCKKKCNDNKKCKKDCDRIKMNIYRNDKQKIERTELKDKLKTYMKKERKDKKKEQNKRIYKNSKKEVVVKEEKVSFIDGIIDNYFNQYEKDKLIQTNDSMKHFFKDCKKVLRLKK